jgi:chromosomal replication initiation ATPase DnaA
MTAPIGPAQRVLVRASELFAVPVDVITGKSRTRPHTAPRFCLAYALRIFSEGKLSYPQIGQLLGGRDHSSIINAFQVFEKLLLDGDEGLADIIAELRVAWDAQVKVAEAA